MAEEELTSIKDLIKKCSDCLDGKIPAPKNCSINCGMYKYKFINKNNK